MYFSPARTRDNAGSGTKNSVQEVCQKSGQRTQMGHHSNGSNAAQNPIPLHSWIHHHFLEKSYKKTLLIGRKL